MRLGEQLALRRAPDHQLLAVRVTDQVGEIRVSAGQALPDERRVDLGDRRQPGVDRGHVETDHGACVHARQRATPDITTRRRSSSRARRRTVRAPARPADPVGLRRSRPLARSWRGHDVGLGDDDRLPTARPHHGDVGDPVVGLVVEDAVGERVRIGPWAHHAAARSRSAAAAGEPPHAAASGAHPRSGRCRAGRRPETRRRRTPPARRRRPGRRPPPPGVRQRVGAAPIPIVRPPSRHSAFSGPCTRERHRTVRHRLAEAQHRRIARRVVGHAVRTVDRRPSDSSSVPDRRCSSTSGRTRRAASRLAGRAWRRRSRRCRTTRSRAARRRRQQPELLGGRRWSTIETRWRALCDPPTLRVSSLTHISWPSASDSIAAAERRDHEALGDGSRERRASPSDMPLARANAHHANRRP